MRPMATTPRDSLKLDILMLLSMGLAMPACAQQTQAVVPTVGLTSTFVKQANVTGTPSVGGTTHDWVTVLSPGLRLASHGANLVIDGSIAFDAYHYDRGTLNDQIVPKGNVLAQWLARDLGVGIEAGWLSRQVPAQFSSAAGAPNGEYTTTEWHAGPFIDKQLGSSTSVQAKLDRKVTHQSNQTAPNTTVTTASAGLKQNPTPLGYRLSIQDQDTKRAGSDTSLLREFKGTAKVFYALTPEWDVGAIFGAESTDVQAEQFRDKIHGWTLHWHPQDRTSLNAEVEQRFFGQSWQVDAAHRMAWLTMAATFSRKPSTSATSQLTNGREFYNLTAQLRQEASGKMTLIGRRDTFTISAGRIDSTPLTQTQSVQTTASNSRDYFFSSDWVHKLTPTWRMSNGLKWTRSHLTPVGQPYVFAREFAWRSELKTDLSQNAIGTFGLRKRIVHTTNYGDSAESAVFAGLDYAF